MPGCPGPGATPFCPFLAKTGGSRWDFFVTIVLPVQASRRFAWVSVQASIFLVLLRLKGSFPTGSSTGPHITSSPPFSPTNESLHSFQQQDAQPYLAHPAAKPHLLGTNALRCASVDSHGSNALLCCTYPSCDTCPTITGAHATIYESRTFFFRACSRRWPTYLQYRSHAHTAGLLSTAPPTTAQHD